MPDNQRMNWTNGEALSADDLNDASDFMALRSADQAYFDRIALVESILAGATIPSQVINIYDAHTANAKAWCLGNAGAPSRSDSMTRPITPGMFAQYVGTVQPDGLAPKLLWARIDDDEVSFTLPSSGGLTRWDLISYNIASAAGGSETRDIRDGATGALSTSSVNKRRSNVITFQRTQGTFGGGIPATPSGDVPLQAISVVSGAAVDDVIDYRYPLDRIQRHTVWPIMGGVEAGTWTYSGFSAASPPGADREFLCPCPTQHGRILRVDIAHTVAVAAASRVRAITATGGNAALSQIADASTGVSSYSVATRIPTAPLWATGRSHPIPSIEDDPIYPELNNGVAAGLITQDETGEKLNAVSFWVAG